MCKAIEATTGHDIREQASGFNEDVMHVRLFLYRKHQKKSMERMKM